MTYTEKELEELAELNGVKFSELDPSKTYIVKVDVSDMASASEVFRHCLSIKECFVKFKIDNVIIVPVGNKYPDLKIFKLEQE